MLRLCKSRKVQTISGRQSRRLAENLGSALSQREIRRIYSNLLEKINTVEMEYKEVASKYIDEIESNKSTIKSFMEMMKENGDELKIMTSEIKTTMSSVAVTAAKAVKDELQAEINQIDTKINNTNVTIERVLSIADYNTKICADKFAKIEDWIGAFTGANNVMQKLIPVNTELNDKQHSI
jgi:hypothetical protein